MTRAARAESTDQEKVLQNLLLEYTPEYTLAMTYARGGVYFRVYSSNDPCSRAESTQGEGSAEFAARSTASDGSPVIRGCARSHLVKRHTKYTFLSSFTLTFYSLVCIELHTGHVLLWPKGT